MKQITVPVWFLVITISACSSVNQTARIEDTIERYRQDQRLDPRLTVFRIEVQNEGGQTVLNGEVDDPLHKESLLRTLSNAGISDIRDRITVLPDDTVAPGQTGVVTVSVANMRRHPGHPAEMVTQVLLGSPLRLLKKETGWYYVQGPDRYLGWLEAEVIALMEPGQESWQSLPQLIFLENYGIARAEPRSDSLAVCDLVVGAKLGLIEHQGSWARVKLPDGRSGFIPDSSIAHFEEWEQNYHLSGQTIEETAKRFLGVPYLWGGTSSKGFDCSGFVKTVFALNGFRLLRDASQQALQGEDIPLDPAFVQLARGDLLFFGQAASEEQTERLTHVAIYLGDLQYIHATPGYVQIASLDPSSPVFDRYNLERLVRAKRLISGQS